MISVNRECDRAFGATCRLRGKADCIDPDGWLENCQT
jgi:hypothetical protein